MKRIFFRVGLCIFFVAAFSSIIYGTGKLKDMQNQRKEIQQQMKKNQEELKAKKDEISVINHEIIQYDQKYFEVQQVLEVLEHRLSEKTNEIEVTKADLASAKNKETEYYANTKERIKVMYEYGNTEYISVLLESDNAMDFYNRLEYLNKIVEYDKAMLTRLEDIREKIEETEGRLIIEKSELEHTQAETLIRKNEIENIRVAKAQQIAKAKASQAYLENEIKERQREEAILNKKIEDYIAALERERLKNKNKSNLKFSAGILKWPIPGRTFVNSDFGRRKDPITLKWGAMHNGVDIPAPAGTPIYAAADGQVMYAGWMNGYGNTIMIDHGKNKNGYHVITLYAHCSSLNVAKDSFVQGGKTIVARVGSTGRSTGNHLHWGLKIGGGWVDPMKNASR